MRRTFVFLSLLGMLGTVAAVGVMRQAPPMPEADDSKDGEAAAPDDDASSTPAKSADGSPDASGDASSDASKGASGDASADESEGKGDAAVPAEPEPLRVVALGWEILAPGVLANGGMKAGEQSRFKEVGLDVTFAAVSDAEQVEVRLGRGGKDDKGADVALMPLPAFAASYERLRALSPQVFFVVAWSRGRDAMVGDADLLRQPPRGEVRVSGAAGSSETLLALFALDQAGVSPNRVKLVEGNKKKRASLEAVQRRKSRELDARRLVMSTADATHLVPVVAVAPLGVVERRRAALARWSKTWMDGARTLSADPPEAARQLAAQKSAPEAVDLIDALGWLEFTDLHEAAQAAGLSGRSAVNLDALFHRTWDLWREIGLLTTPPPERVPLSATIIADLARETTALTPKTSRVAARGDAETLLVRTVPGRRLNAEAESSLVSEVGFLAGVFSRSTLEVWIPRSPEAAERVANHASDRFGLPEGRVVVRRDKDRKAGKAAVITVRAAQ
ncbi:MAG: hypothetical protein AAGF11_02285 [Myxococcota bacterium]